MPHKKYDYYLSLTANKEEIFGETFMMPVRLDSGVRLWGEDENNRIGIVRLTPNALEGHSEYLGNFIETVDGSGIDIFMIPFAGKLTIRNMSTNGSMVENFSAFIDLDDKYYGKYNMQVNRIRVNETTEGFQVGFMRNNTTLFSIDSEMR